MSSRTQSPGSKIVNRIDDTAADPSIQWGGSPVNPSGTGIRGTDATVVTSINGTDRITATSTGVAIAGTQTVSSTLNVVGNFSVATNKMTVDAATGNTIIAGTLGVTGDVAIATNKVTIAAATGNTAIAGTLGVTGAATAASVAIGGGTVITKVLKGTVSIAITALLTNTQADVAVALTGAAAGDIVVVTPLDAAMEAGVAIVAAWVGSADHITVRVANIGAGTLTGSTTNFSYMIVKS